MTVVEANQVNSEIKCIILNVYSMLLLQKLDSERNIFSKKMWNQHFFITLCIINTEL